MRWIDYYPPRYVWEGDLWFNTINGQTYQANNESRSWKCITAETHPIHFPIRTKWMGKRSVQTVDKVNKEIGNE